MKTTTYLSTIMSAISLYACAGTDSGSQSQCTSNADCKGGRICDTVKGICSDPNTNTGSNMSVDAVIRQYDSGSQISKIKGDVNCDGKVDVSDVHAFEDYWMKNTPFSCTSGKSLADMNCDGSVNVTDLNILANSVNGMKNVYMGQDGCWYVLKGDADCDGNIGQNDITVITNYLAEKRASFPCGLGIHSADANCDGDITFADQKLIKDYVAGKIKEFPCK